MTFTFVQLMLDFNKLVYHSFLPFLLWITIIGCEENEAGLIDRSEVPAFLRSSSLIPDTINIDRLVPVNGVYTVTTTMQTSLSASTVPQLVSAMIFRPNTSDFFSQFHLRDDGILPDLDAGDSLYSGEITFSLVRSQAGRYRVHTFASDDRGNLSNTIALSLILMRNNSAPFLSNLVAPDTVDLPVGGSITIQFTVAAADSDGLADIRSVTFRRLLPPDSLGTRFLLKDDGGLDPPGVLGLRSGDQFAGDGFYSVLIPLVDGQAQRRTNLFGFQALDTFGDTSTTIQKYVTVR